MRSHLSQRGLATSVARDLSAIDVENNMSTSDQFPVEHTTSSLIDRTNRGDRKTKNVLIMVLKRRTGQTKSLAVVRLFSSIEMSVSREHDKKKCFCR